MYFRALTVVVDVDTIMSRQLVVQQIQKQAQGRILLAQGLSQVVIWLRTIHKTFKQEYFGRIFTSIFFGSNKLLHYNISGLEHLLPADDDKVYLGILSQKRLNA